MDVTKPSYTDGQTWLVLVKADVKRERTGDHVAFQVSAETLKTTEEKLKSMGHESILARGGSALYFFDYDNHVFELDTQNLDEELGPES